MNDILPIHARLDFLAYMVCDKDYGYFLNCWKRNHANVNSILFSYTSVRSGQQKALFSPSTSWLSKMQLFPNHSGTLFTEELCTWE
jgi:hypothetical protein